jgi:imidazolonepropionase-like amidohydrolase
VLPYALEALVDGIGMTPEEALRASTSVAADALALGASKGRLAAGADADVLVIHGNPLADIAAVRNVESVFRAGVRVP